ncbi:Serine/threonine-protein kinase PknD [Streptomyces sp. RB5]|uniref:non-specific serine/threonine protein kinase n=1 Tax=Streptomyces smaragdinus TaxID=2585196 RepID=A0A7K0CHF7_9ACTN|nr:protein kinase [Streptomyces smaragdinus]MQY12743.1 Serine/threonine-protein kinase PknD [Streptomyces smaragdinus]
MAEHGAPYDHAGRSLGGRRYQLKRELGAGGMASVHLAHDTYLDRDVAVKTLHSELGREDSFRERFRREAQAVARLSHPNVVSVFDTGEERGADGSVMPYIVMEYVEGEPLRDVLDADIARYGAMPADKALRITADVLAALDASHEMGLVHRDIKPGNVMIDKRGQVKVMDFGIARAVQSGVTSMTQTGMVVGTPQYLSPEQALGRGVDARSDLYSVGIMLFELLTGRLPFDADSPLAIAYAHVQETPPNASAFNQAVPPVVDALVMRALAKNPNERFASAQDMLAEARRAGGLTPPGAMPAVVAAPHQQAGSGVGSAVFPPVNPQAGPYHSPPPGAPQGYQPLSQYATGGYGHPPAPQTPQQGGFQTPPPYTITPQQPGPSGGGGGGNRNLMLIVTAAVVAIAAVAGTIIFVALGGDDKKDNGGDGPTPTASASVETGADGGSKPDGYRPPERSRTIDVTKCTEAREDYDDSSKISLPDFTYKDWHSVRDCITAAGWQYTTEERDDNLWAKDTVLDQNIDPFDGFDPKSDKIKLVLATGYPQQ